MKKLVSIVLAVVMLFSLVACSNTTTSQPEQPAQQGTSGAAAPEAPAAPEFDGEIVIGACSDMTGKGAANGQGEAFAYQMIADEINAKGGVLGKKLVIKQEDTNGTVEGAVNAINKHFTDPNIVAVFGLMYSAHVLGVADIVLQAKKPLLHGGASPSISELKNPYLFRMRPADVFVVKAYLGFIQEQINPKKIGFLYGMDDNGTQGFNVATEYCKEVGLEMVADGFPDGTKDFYSQLLMIKDAGVDCLVLWCHDEELAIITRQRFELEMEDLPIYGGSAMGSNIYSELAAPEEAKGCYGVAESSDYGNDWEPYVEFRDRFEAAYGHLINNNICGLAPSIYLLCDAMERAGTTEAEALCKALRETKDFKTISGYLTCDEEQSMNHNSIIYQMDGEMKRAHVALYTAKV